MKTPLCLRYAFCLPRARYGTSTFAAGDTNYIAKLNELANANFTLAAKQATNFTATKGFLYPLNANALTVTLPLSPTSGDRISFFSCSSAVTSVTFGRNGNNIDSAAADKTLSGNEKAVNVDLVYVDSSIGWRIEQWFGQPTISPTPKQNAVIGGDFSRNLFQRGVSTASPTNGAFVADCWQWASTSAGVITATKSSASVPSVALAGRLITHCLDISVTTADASVAIGDVSVITHRIEGTMWKEFAQRPCAIAFAHAHTKTGTHSIALRNTGTDRSIVIEYTQNVADAWELAVLDLPASPAAGTWTYDATAFGVELGFCLMTGATLGTSTIGSWQSGNFRGSNAQVNNLDSTSNHFRIADVWLIEGAVAEGVEPFQRSVSDEILLQRRYYRRITSDGTNTAFLVTGMVASATQAGFPLAALTTGMRAAPTVGFSAVGDLAVQCGATSFAATVAAVNAGSYPENPLLTLTTAGGMTTGAAAWVTLGAATKFIEFSSVL